MSRRLKTDDYEEQDGWITKIKNQLFREVEDEEEEDDAFAPAPPMAAQTPRQTGGGGGRGKSGPNGTLLQVHAHRGSQITKRAPRSLSDAQRAAEDLKERRPVIVNLERADDELARRVIDFISGVTYALNGFYERVGDKVFLFTPANIIIADEDEVEPGGKGLYSEDGP